MLEATASDPTSFFIEVAKQVPSLALFVVVVIVFLRYQEKLGTAHSDHVDRIMSAHTEHIGAVHERHERALTEIVKRYEGIVERNRIIDDDMIRAVERLQDLRCKGAPPSPRDA